MATIRVTNLKNRPDDERRPEPSVPLRAADESEKQKRQMPAFTFAAAAAAAVHELSAEGKMNGDTVSISCTTIPELLVEEASAWNFGDVIKVTDSSKLKFRVFDPSRAVLLALSKEYFACKQVRSLFAVPSLAVDWNAWIDRIPFTPGSGLKYHTDWTLRFDGSDVSPYWTVVPITVGGYLTLMLLSLVAPAPIDSPTGGAADQRYLVKLQTEMKDKYSIRRRWIDGPQECGWCVNGEKVGCVCLWHGGWKPWLSDLVRDRAAHLTSGEVEISAAKRWVEEQHDQRTSATATSAAAK